MILTVRNGVVFAVGAVAIAACGNGSGPTGDSESASTIVATTSIWADITSSTLCGLDVPAVIPNGADPHTFEPSLRDRELLENAEIVVANGGGLEDSLTDLLSTVESTGTAAVEMVPLVDTIESDDHDDDHDEDSDGDADHDGRDDHRVDPHIWQDPRRVSSALDAIAAADPIGGRDPGCLTAYRSELEALDAEIEAMLDVIPPADRLMVTSHDSLAYFADRYDLEIIGTVIPSTNTLAQTNAADLDALAVLIEQRGVRAIFTEQLESTADADALAERLDVAVVPLVTDALTDDPATDTYVEMMRFNATQVAAALTP